MPSVSGVSSSSAYSVLSGVQIAGAVGAGPAGPQDVRQPLAGQSPIERGTSPGGLSLPRLDAHENHPHALQSWLRSVCGPIRKAQVQLDRCDFDMRDLHASPPIQGYRCAWHPSSAAQNARQISSVVPA